MKYYKVLYIPKAKFIVNPYGSYNSLYYTENNILSLKYGEYCLHEPEDYEYLLPVSKYDERFNTFKFKNECLEVLEVKHAFDDAMYSISKLVGKHDHKYIEDISSKFTEEDLVRLEDIYQLFKTRMKLEGCFGRDNKW